LVADLQDLENMNWFDAMDTAEDDTSQGYYDWALPSIQELELMYNMIVGGADNAVGFEDYWYWSSSEHNNYFNYAWSVNLTNGNKVWPNKDAIGRVRIIRSF
jgi:hypothetical protein